jgi:transcriptional regulator with XRE-family HTH domain
MTKPRHILAREWRDRLDLTFAELSARTGYPVKSIQEYESGKRSGKSPDGKSKGPISEGHWTRYALACAACEKNLKLPF